ncbi:MAG TPA: DNA-directed RNA polymerase subunit omega [Ignavibacteria bacterium]|nr:DNA-directed RNA polymerase subunit omega [Ignavibacteria bacterium]
MPIRPIELRKLETKTSNVYEAVIVAAKRARNINDQAKLEFTTLLNTMIPNVDDEFEEKENPDQLRLSLEFENRKKPHLQAIDELIEGKVEFRYKEDLV